ncbi:hypothetical protein HMPREF0381_2830, partial [Lachnoanaerobaculum saburreum DSM 3986]
MCKALKFPRSTYYKDLICEPSNKRKEHVPVDDLHLLPWSNCLLRKNQILISLPHRRYFQDK